MKEPLEIKTQASEQVVFSALADEANSQKNPDVNLWGVRVSVNSSRFGTDEAISIRLRSKAGEAEIGKILMIPLNDGHYLFKVPLNQTGGATMPELDSSGERFTQVLIGVLRRLLALGLIAPSEREKRRLGFQLPGEGLAS